MEERPDAPDTGDVDHLDLGLERMIFFSDAVFAIVITLLVLPLTSELSIPDDPSQLADEVLDMAPRVMTFAISFLVIGQFWVAHHRLFNRVRRDDGGLLWMNLVFLLFVSFMPFPSAVLGESSGSNETFAVTFYATSLTVASLALSSTWLYAARRGLADPRLSSSEMRQFSIRAVVTTSVFAVSILLSPLGIVPPVLCWLVLLPVARALVARRQRMASQ